MALYVLENRATLVEFVPPERITSATVSVRSKDGAELSAPSATPDTTNAEIGAVTTGTEFVLESAVVPGRQYWWVRDGGAYESLVRAAEWNAGTMMCRLESPPATSEVYEGDAIRGARVTTTVPAITPRGLYHRIEWTCVGVDGVTRLYTQAMHVCRTLFRPPVLPDEVARYIAETFPNVSYGRPFGYFAERARRASLRIEKELLKAERFQDRIGDYDVFVEAGVVAIKLELAEEGLVPTSDDPTSYKRDLKAELGDAVTAALSGTWYDENDDGVVDEDTEVAGFMSFDLERL